MPSRSKKTKKRKRSPPPLVLTDEQEEQIKNAFQAAVKDDSGCISVKKARRAIRSLGLNVDKEAIQSVSTDEGTIDYSTFYNLTGPKLVQRTKALRAFEIFDKDGKGVVCLEDLQRVAIELEEEISEQELIEMLEDADKEGQGFLSKEDFLNVADSLNL